MTNRKEHRRVSTTGEPPLAIADYVLERLAAITGAKNDSALARALDVSPQALFNWRKRGTVPYDAAARFAYRTGVSLDHLVLGRYNASGQKRPDGPLVLELLRAIELALRERGMKGDLIGPASLIYNRLWDLPAGQRLASIQREADYAVAHLEQMMVPTEPGRRSKRKRR